MFISSTFSCQTATLIYSTVMYLARSSKVCHDQDSSRISRTCPKAPLVQACLMLLHAMTNFCLINSRPTVPYGPVPGWNLFHFWHRSYQLCHERRRRSGWSCHLHLSTNDQMYLSQIWFFRKHRKPWRPLYLANQHCQRENLCFPLVLVLAPW